MAHISGAVDLSGLAQSQASSKAPSGAYVTEVTQETFESTLRKSIQYPIVVEFYSAQAPESAAMGQTLTELADAAAGSWLLARMNVDLAPQIVQALQIRAVPMVVGVLSGQMVPMWQGSMPKQDAEKIIGEFLKMAAGNGILGKAEPQSAADAASEAAAEPEEDPRYAPAYEAMGNGDHAAARDAFAALLQDNPADALAKIGVAQSGLLSRVDTLDFDTTIATANRADATIDQVMAAADCEVASGQVAEGFARLTGAIAQASPDDKETLRLRLLELFDTQEPSDKAVLTARRHLATALF